jgi:hypothetical protein
MESSFIDLFDSWNPGIFARFNGNLINGMLDKSNNQYSITRVSLIMT